MEIIYKSVKLIIKQCLKYRYGVDFFVIDKLQKIQFIMIIDIV